MSESKKKCAQTKKTNRETDKTINREAGRQNYKQKKDEDKEWEREELNIV